MGLHLILNQTVCDREKIYPELEKYLDNVFPFNSIKMLRMWGY